MKKEKIIRMERKKRKGRKRENEQMNILCFHRVKNWSNILPFRKKGRRKRIRKGKE